MNELGGCPWCGAEHITIRNNLFKTIAGAVNILAVNQPACGVPHNVDPRPVGFVKLDNNLFQDVRPVVSLYWPPNPYWVNPSWSGVGDFLIVLSSDIPARRVHDLKVSHVTAEGNSHLLYFICQGTGACIENLSIRDSILERGAYGVFRSSTAAEGSGELASSVTGIRDWTRNLVVNNSEYTDQVRSDSALATLYPSGCQTINTACDSTRQTFIASSWDTVGFVGRQIGNFALSSTSPFKGKASDGTDVGVDVSRLEAALAPAPETGGNSSGSGGSSPSGPPATTGDPVIWINPTPGTMISGSGTTLNKIDICNGCPVGARSRQELTGDGWVEFVMDSQDKIRYFGLTNADSAPNGSQIDFAFKLWGLSDADVREDDRAYIYGKIARGDRFRIAVENRIVKYYRNGVLLYTSTRNPVFPLHVEATMSYVGDSIAGMTMSSSSSGSVAVPPSPTPPPSVGTPISWTGASSGAAISGGTVSKTDFCFGCPQGARSTQELPGNGYVEYTVNTTGSIRYFGLTNASNVPNYQAIDYAFKFWGMSAVDAREDDRFINLGQHGTVAEGDKFRITVESGVVKYSKNGNLLYTSTVRPVFPLHVEVVLFDLGGEVKNVVMQLQ